MVRAVNGAVTAAAASAVAAADQAAAPAANTRIVRLGLLCCCCCGGGGALSIGAPAIPMEEPGLTVPGAPASAPPPTPPPCCGDNPITLPGRGGATGVPLCAKMATILSTARPRNNRSKRVDALRYRSTSPNAASGTCST